MRFFVYIRYLFLLAFLLAGSGIVLAQDNQSGLLKSLQDIDSLKLLLNEEPITEERKMEIYGIISHRHANFNQDSTLHYSYKMLELAQKLNDYENQIEVIARIGVAYCFKGEYETALAYFTKMMELAIAQGDKIREASSFSLFGFTYSKAGKYHTAIDYYLKALKIAEQNEIVTRFIHIYTNLSSIYRNLGNTEMAFQYLKQANEQQAIANSMWIQPTIWNEYAYNYLDMNDLDMALHYALKADSINTFVWNSVNTLSFSYTMGLLAQIYLQLGEYDRALYYATESYKRAEETTDKNLFSNAGKILSDIYLAQKHYAEAETAALQIWETDSTYIIDSRAIARNITLTNIYMGNTERAAYFLKKYSELNDRYSEKSFQTIVSDLAIHYETEKKEMRITSLEKERQLYVWLGIAGGLLAVVLGVVLWQSKRNARKEKQLIATRSILDGEMKERKRLAQDLHDRLSGNLSAIKLELSKSTDALQNARNQLDKCINDIRDTAHDLMPVSLQFGMKVALEDFAAQFPNVWFHFFGEEKRIKARIEFVVYCCAVELVNNAIKHSGAQNINLQLVQDKKYVTLTVSDDGCGFNEKTTTKGFGLKSIKERVLSCNGKIDISTSPDMGTETTIVLKIDDYLI